MRKFFIIIALAVAFAGPAFSAGGSLSLYAEKTSVAPGDTFSVSILADSSGAESNTVGVDVNFPGDLLNVVSISGPTTISMFVAKGVMGKGLVSIQGGILPAKILKADPIGTITFKALSSGAAVIAIAPSSGIYENNGRGTPVPVVLGAVKITIAPAASANPAPAAPAPAPVIVPAVPAPMASQPAPATPKPCMTFWSWLIEHQNRIIIYSLLVIILLGLYAGFKEIRRKKHRK